jgi:hypothetical protein
MSFGRPRKAEEACSAAARIMFRLARYHMLTTEPEQRSIVSPGQGSFGGSLKWLWTRSTSQS